MSTDFFLFLFFDLKKKEKEKKRNVRIFRHYTPDVYK
jgi:hypothetical protein